MGGSGKNEALEHLQGVWKIQRLRADGQTMAPGALAVAAVIVRGNRFESVGMGYTYLGRMTLDAGASPARIDLEFTSGPPKGQRQLGIYRVRGDEWTLCLATTGTKRPSTFAAPAGSGIVLETLTRTAGKPAPATERGPDLTPPRRSTAGRKSPRGPASPIDGEWAMVDAVMNGVPLPASMARWCRRLTQGGETRVIAGPQTMLHASFTIDTSTMPHAIEYVTLTGDNAGEAQSGIVELRDGILSICMSAPGAARPTAFESKKGDGRAMTRWKKR
jgi:uncharacterized protein (TIGR03067 family)